MGWTDEAVFADEMRAREREDYLEIEKTIEQLCQSDEGEWGAYE